MHPLIIGRSNSRCGTCGKGADPYQKFHVSVLQYSPDWVEGCGAKWDVVTSDYSGEEMRQAVVDMRPDLPFIQYSELMKVGIR